MQTETAMAAAMKAAGIDLTSARIRALAIEHLRRYDDTSMGRSRFAEAVWTEILKPIWELAAQDMSGKGLPGAGRGGIADKAPRDVPASRQPDAAEAGHPADAPVGQWRDARPAATERGEVGHASIADEADVPVPASPQPNADGRGHQVSAGKAISASPSPSAPHRERPGQITVASKGHTSGARPAREPSTGEIVAMAKAHRLAASSIWNRSIGGELTLGTATRQDLRTLARKFRIGEHQVGRLMTEFAWPDDDKTTLKEIATEDAVRKILESGAQALRAMEMANG